MKQGSIGRQPIILIVKREEGNSLLEANVNSSINFSVAGAVKVILFFLFSFILGICSIVLFVLAFPIIPIFNPWVNMLIESSPVFASYLISGMILKACTKNWNAVLYFIAGVICGIVNYTFGFQASFPDFVFQTVYPDYDSGTYIFINSLKYLAPTVGVFSGAVVMGKLLMLKSDLEE